jgi:hypothetical protein
MLIHDPTKSVLLKVSDPFAIRELLPKSKTLNHVDYNVAVKHTLEATKVLRNIGISVPAPIRSRYNWPGKFKPFKHQVDTAEFLTLHRKAFVLSEMGCVDAETEYLSPTGWRRIDSYTGGPVAQYHPDSKEAEFVEPTEYVKLPCTDMFRVKTKYGLDQVLSPEHRVLVQAKANPDKLEVLSAGQLYVRQAHWQNNDSLPRAPGRIGWTQITIPVTFSLPTATSLTLTDAQLRVQVAVMADGHFPANSQTNHCVVRLKKQRKKERMRELLVAAGIPYHEREQNTATAQGFTIFSFTAPLRLKHYDERFWSASTEQKYVIADEVIHWDGTFRKAEGLNFFTTVKQAADYIQFVFSSLGHAARITVQERTRNNKHETLFVVVIRPNVTALMVANKSSDGEKYATVTPTQSPDGFKYCFMVPSTFLVLRRNGCIFCTGNTGKTNAALWAADWLMSQGFVKRALVLSPLSTLERVWKNDIFDTLMHRVASVVHGSRDDRLGALAVDADFYILNHDGINIKEVAEAVRKRPDINLVIMDEGSMFRNHDTKKYKSLVKMLRDDMRLWWMTGTPCPNAPTDAWAQAQIVSPSRIPKFFGSFKRQTMAQVTQFKWVPKPDAYETAYQAMQPAVRFKKADCLDLPPVTSEDRQCGLTKEQRHAFEEMRKNMQAEAKEVQITAVNAADKINKLRQILCIAQGTLVLTSSGWVKIECVTPGMLVWDGCSWVPQDGVVFKGIADTVVVDGVRMTPEHEVMTDSGWVTAQEIIHGYASNRFNRTSVRLPDSYQTLRDYDRHISKGHVALPMYLRKTSSAREPESTSKKPPEREALWLQTQTNQQKAQYVIHPAIQNMVAYETTLFRPIIQGLEKLRRTWYHSSYCLVSVFRKFLARHAARVFGQFNIRAYRQQCRVYTRQLPVGNTERAEQQHTSQRTDTHTQRYNDVDSSSTRVQFNETNTNVSVKTRMEYRKSVNNTSTKMAVYDLVNCGPNNRFTVCGNTGELLLVHNCGAVKDPVTETYLTLPHGPRKEVLLECIEQASAKVIVIVPFKGIIQTLSKELTPHYSNDILNGDVSLNRRNQIISNFKHGTDPHVLLCHPKVMSHGLNLTEADTLIFYAPIYSNDEAQQVTERFNRAGQTRKMTIIRIGAHPIEWEIYKMLDTKRVTQDNILKLYKSITE